MLTKMDVGGRSEPSSSCQCFAPQHNQEPTAKTWKTCVKDNGNKHFVDIEYKEHQFD